MTGSAIHDHRVFYANFVVRSTGSSDSRLIEAFAAVNREAFVGPGPWSIFVNPGYIPTPSDDPAFLYQDILVGLAADRGINNGQPSLHARCLAACTVKVGEAVVHVGAGTGYYSAILSHLVGHAGSVIAYEIEPDLAEWARKNLRTIENVVVEGSSAVDQTLPKADLIYVNAGATHPPGSWLDALNIGGRLIFPLTTNEGFGVMLLVTRRSAGSYAARVVLPVAFIPCIGARDEQASMALAAALRTRAIMATKSLCRHSDPDESACCVGDGWWLSTSEPPSQHPAGG
jgi:protein-L-isoaspartate(D-aspartate) O-methyltransferase